MGAIRKFSCYYQRATIVLIRNKYFLSAKNDGKKINYSNGQLIIYLKWGLFIRKDHDALREKKKKKTKTKREPAPGEDQQA